MLDLTGQSLKITLVTINLYEDGNQNLTKNEIWKEDNDVS